MFFLSKNKQKSDEFGVYEKEAEKMLENSIQKDNQTFPIGEWVDDNGVHWSRSENGPLYMWNPEANVWEQVHQN